ncbi:MAG: cupin protein [Rhodospirillales bacterium]|nr:cupin protein [Rhodospirillales bacterium]
MKRFGILAVTMSLLVASGDLAITTADAQTARPPPAAAELRITRAGSQPSARVARRLVQRFGARRPAVRGHRAVAHDRGQRHLRARRPFRLAHASAGPSAGGDRRGRLGAARGRAGRGDAPGDVVWIPPGLKHWHGAAATTGVTHIALTEELEGQVATWLEQVSDQQYRR